jgi:FtsP/CotA-like multicopper oxidase with cupredoxin domain
MRPCTARCAAPNSTADSHTYQIGDLGPRKDTAIVLPKKKLSVFFDADNPGPWMLHCHNAYHGEAGMMANMAYRA